MYSQLSPDAEDSVYASEYRLNRVCSCEEQTNSADEGIIILYIQMQLCDGETLEDFLKKNPLRTNESLKWNIFRQVLEAVNYLH